MSLDVTLLVPGEDKEEFNSYEMRHLATNFAITCGEGYTGSYDSWFQSLAPSWKEIANQNNPDYEQPTKEIYTSNITHNLGNMAEHAGLYNALWRPYKLKAHYAVPENDYEAEMEFESSTTVRAYEIILILGKGLEDLKARPEYYEQFNSPNGWGIYANFVPFVEEYLNACKENPEAIIKVDR